MSLFRKLFGREEPKEASDDSTTAIAEPSGSVASEEVALTAEAMFEALTTAPSAPRQGRAKELFERLQGEGREARAIDLSRRLLLRFQDPSLTVLVADALLSRGAAADAQALLTPLTKLSDVSLPALMLAGEAAERVGDAAAAVNHYQRVLARDLDYPQAQGRIRRLKEERTPRRELAGATLLTDGALTRGRYRVLSELGRGGAGTVFRAEDTMLGRSVALKVYHRRGRSEQERLLVEARTPARIEHPGVVRIFDLDQKLGAIAMEWVSSGSVRAELRKGPVPIRRALGWLVSATEALEAVHEHEFAHRDVKPSNFLLRPDGRIVLTDFGLAARVGEEVVAVGGLGEGTLKYMAPEQKSAARSHPSSDIYSLGVCLDELVQASDLPETDATAELRRMLWELSARCQRIEPSARLRTPELRNLLLGAHAQAKT